jgi:5'-3' exonuclease
MTNYILIDGSYFVFFRYYAILNWFRLSHPDNDPKTADNHQDFRNKFIKTFSTSFQDIAKRLKINEPTFIVGKDCPRKNIWRMQQFASYKENRVYEDTFMIGDYFKAAYDYLYYDSGASGIVEHPRLEADDCIAILSKKIKEINPTSKIWIITSDMDYLQLASPNIQIYNLKFKKLTESKNSFNDPKKDLFCKIVMGDKSDNIKGVFKKCGIKTASKYYENPELFKKKLDQENAHEQYAFNKKIIDFNEIPKNFIQEFLETYGFTQ